MVPRFKDGVMNSPMGYRETQARLVESYNVRCDCEQGPRVVGKLCKTDFAVTRFSWHRPAEWKDVEGKLARRRRCRPLGGPGGGGGNGGGGGWQWPMEGEILFWVGHRPGWVDESGVYHPDYTDLIMPAVHNAIRRLRDMGYDARYVGRTREKLEQAKLAPCMLGLYVAGHGGCTYTVQHWQYKSAGCWINDSAGKSYVVTDFDSPVDWYGALYNDWHELRASTRTTFKRLYTDSCLVNLNSQEHGSTIERWYADRIGVPASKVSVGQTDKGGLSFPAMAVGHINQFVLQFFIDGLLGVSRTCATG